MRYVLDTTLFVDYVNGREAAIALFRRLSEQESDLLVCDVVLCEAMSGGTEEQREQIGRLIEPLEYLSTHPDAARWAGESRQSSGQTSHRTLGDALIAGVAWYSKATIVTRNPDDFVAQGIPVLVY